MALLQIAEPGESTAPHQHRLAVGIDLGTTNSLIATVKSGSAEVLIGHDGEKLTASVVRYFADGRCEVGAKPRAEQADEQRRASRAFFVFVRCPATASRHRCGRLPG